MRRTIRLGGPDTASVTVLARRFDDLRAELAIPALFPDEVLRAAEAAAANPSDPDADLTAVPFLTVDPPGSTDLDQAMSLSRRGQGYRVEYAIADISAFVVPHGAVDREARRRGQTLYAPDARTPLHPPVLSEGAASLLPGQRRLAFVWRLDLDASGAVTAVDLVRARVRSRHRLDYAQVQAACDAGSRARGPVPVEVADQALLLREVGERRMALERERGGASLPLPEQEVTADRGRYRLVLRPVVAAEEWNAQISLMTGMAAADLMLEARIGVLRTLPGPEPGTVERFRRQAEALGVPWPSDVPYGAFLRSLDGGRPRDLALMHEAGSLFRGAGYTPMDGAVPSATTHAAVAAPYAHVTAPLRRLVDRFGLVVCHALACGAEVPAWAREALDQLPEAMRTSDRLAGELERRATDVVEAAVLAHRVGEVFDATVVDVRGNGTGTVQVLEPAVLARCAGPLELGARVGVRLVTADVTQGTVRFEPAAAGPILAGADEPDGRPRQA